MRDEDRALRIVLCWHMHQPDYREPLEGRYLAPWTYLHAIKDYSDMAAHLEEAPGAVAVFNFSPVLLDQLDDYRLQLDGFFSGRSGLRDPLLAALGDPVLPVGEDPLRSLMHACLRLERTRMVDRFPGFRRLAEMADWVLAHPDMSQYIETRLVGDLLVWYHLAWLGESVRERDPRAMRLTEKGRGYDSEDRRELLAVIHEVIAAIPLRYRALAQRNRVEISMSPYAHPILPLLLDFKAAREALPDILLPMADDYPAGGERARWHLAHGIQVHTRYFGAAPPGCWPSEGGLSAAAVALLNGQGFRWTASGQRVLLNSLGLNSASSDTVHRIYQLNGSDIALFFRDDELSDLIGFRYKDWHAEDAVGDLIHRLAAIAEEPAEPGRVVCIILDGENPWEYYPENGRYFLSELYHKLADDPRFRLTTFSRCIDDAAMPRRPLARLCAGSWVFGDFSTWMGHADKNQAWDMLVDARKQSLAALANRHLDGPDLARLERQLAVCEGSDWFWWPGEYNPEASVSEFEHLFRAQLAGLYHLLGLPPPDYLAAPFSHGASAAEGGIMRPARLP